MEPRLTKRENQIAGLVACGMAKKEIAAELGVGYGTVNVILDKAYKKSGTSKLNELGAWWLNKAYALHIDWKDLKRRIIATGMALLILDMALNYDASSFRTRRAGRRGKDDMEIVMDWEDLYEME